MAVFAKFCFFITTEYISATLLLKAMKAA